MLPIPTCLMTWRWSGEMGDACLMHGAEIPLGERTDNGCGSSGEHRQHAHRTMTADASTIQHHLWAAEGE